MGGGRNNRKRQRSDAVLEKTEVSDQEFRELQSIAAKANAQLAAVKKSSQKSEDGPTRHRSSHGNRPCGPFNFWGCNRSGEECEYAHVDSREAMSRYQGLMVARKWNIPTSIRGQIADWRKAEIAAAGTPDIAKSLDPTIRDSTAADVLSDNFHDPTMLPTYAEQRANIVRDIKEERKHVTETTFTQWRTEKEEDNGEEKDFSKMVSLATAYLREREAKLLSDLEAKRREESRDCFLMHERVATSEEGRKNKVYAHRFNKVKPGSMGYFGWALTTDNTAGVAILTQNLIDNMYHDWQHGENMTFGFACAYCRISLAVAQRRPTGEARILACRACFSVLYCCSEHRGLITKSMPTAATTTPGGKPHVFWMTALRSSLKYFTRLLQPMRSTSPHLPR